jgi:hypothetical protein
MQHAFVLLRQLATAELAQRDRQSINEKAA